MPDVTCALAWEQNGVRCLESVGPTLRYHQVIVTVSDEWIDLAECRTAEPRLFEVEATSTARLSGGYSHPERMAALERRFRSELAERACGQGVFVSEGLA